MTDKPASFIKHRPVWLPMSSAELARKLKVVGSVIMMIIGLSFYYAYGVAYGDWNMLQRGNEGVYAIFLFFFGLGLLGFIMFRKKTSVR